MGMNDLLQMERADPNFRNDAMKSEPYVWLAMQLMYKKMGRMVAIHPTRIRGKIEDMSCYTDDGDFDMVIPSVVKQWLGSDFHNIKEIPEAFIALGRASLLENPKDRPGTYYIVNKSCTGCVVMETAKSDQHWVRQTQKAEGSQREDEYFLCPKEFFEFHALTPVEDTDPNMGVMLALQRLFIKNKMNALPRSGSFYKGVKTRIGSLVDVGIIEIFVRMEVKHRQKFDFTSKEEFLARFNEDQVIVDACHIWDNAIPKPKAYFIFNSSGTAYLYVERSTREHWIRAVNVKDNEKNRRRNFYKCPLQFCPLVKVPKELTAEFRIRRQYRDQEVEGQNPVVAV